MNSNSLTNQRELLIQRLDATSEMASFEGVARLHMDYIHFGLLPLLGQRFLARLYFEITQSSGSGVWVAQREGEIVGFVAGSASIRAVYGEIFRRSLFSLLWLAGWRLFRPAVLSRSLSIISFPLRLARAQSQSTVSLPRLSGELLAIAVAPTARGLGVGRRLIRELDEEMRRHGRENITVSTNVADPNSNAFYQSLGFQPLATVKHHRLVLQVYQKNIVELPN